jgi:hypothetical protein
MSCGPTRRAIFGSEMTMRSSVCETVLTAKWRTVSCAAPPLSLSRNVNSALSPEGVGTV